MCMDYIQHITHTYATHTPKEPYYMLRAMQEGTVFHTIKLKDTFVLIFLDKETVSQRSRFIPAGSLS